MIPFNVPPCVGDELEYVKQAIDSHKIDQRGLHPAGGHRAAGDVRGVHGPHRAPELPGHLSLIHIYDVSFDTARVYKVTATVVLEQDGKEYVFTKDITLDVLNADDLVPLQDFYN